ncbi:MAG: ATPase, T2SS/T4P/T4SS family [Pirellulaceae bacterium]
MGGTPAQSFGLVLTSAMPGDGKTTIWRCSLNAADRFVRDFIGFEDKRHSEPEVINVDVQTYDSSAGETPLKLLPQALLKQPDVLCLSDLVSGDVFDSFLDQAVDQQKFVIGHIPARSATEALVRVLALGTDPELLAKTVQGVLYQRVLRKLCDNCRQPYSPPPELLKQLGIRPGRVQTLYGEWQPPPPEMQVDEKGNPIEIPICPRCHGVGYQGRAAIYELLVVNDEIRDAIRRKADLAEMMTITSKAHVPLRDEGVVLVAKGVTSVEELQRVLQR